jgi:hypothetical protein
MEAMPPSLAVCAGEATATPFAWSRWVVVLVGAAILPAIVLLFLSTVGKPSCQDQDFGACYRGAAAVDCDTTPYVVDEHGPMGTYPYAPAYAYLLIPLSRLDYLWACRLWLVLNLLAAAGCLALGWQLVGGNGPLPARRLPATALALAATAAYFWATLRVGQVSLFMLLGCLAWAVLRRHGHCFKGGLCLAAACATKLAPGAILPYLLLRRDFRGLAGVALGGLLLFLVPAVRLGLDGSWQLHCQWLAHATATQVPMQTYRPGNQSLLAQLARLPPFSDGHRCYSADDLNRLCRLYPVVVALLVAAFYGWLQWTGRGLRFGDRRRETWEISLLLVLITLAHPRGWRCNFVALLPACLLLAAEVTERRRRAAGAALAFVILACFCPTDGVGISGWSPGAWLLLGKHFWGAIAVAAACWWCCHAELGMQAVSSTT